MSYNADRSTSEEIDDIISNIEGWKGQLLSQLRACITQADPDLIEEVKWKKPSKPEGVPVWSHDGIVCVADTLKAAVRLTFPHGAEVADPHKLFNMRLDSKTVRAIDFDEYTKVETQALQTLIVETAARNTSKAARKRKK